MAVRTPMEKQIKNTFNLFVRFLTWVFSIEKSFSEKKIIQKSVVKIEFVFFNFFV